MFTTLDGAVSEAANRAQPAEDANHRKPAAPPVKRPLLLWNDIRDLAHQKWEAAGRPLGDCVRFWLEAEQELQGNRKPS